MRTYDGTGSAVEGPFGKGARTFGAGLLLAATLFGQIELASAQAVRGPRAMDGTLIGHANVLGPNDDGSAGPVDIGFEINLFGFSYTQLFANNNGNLTFGSDLSTYTPFDLTSTETPIIAPFFADVDTRTASVTPERTGLLSWDSYAADTPFGSTWGRSVFSATWNGVGYYSTNTDKRNTFQVNLVERFDTGNGNFDIEFNYDQIQWETGDASNGVNGLGGNSARAGFSAGTGDPGTAYELPGSAINGAFVDGGPNALVSGSHGTFTPGRYLFEVRNSGVAVPGAAEETPVLPSQTVVDETTGVTTFVFNNAISGNWFDPPASGYQFEATNSTLFTGLTLPTTGFAGTMFEIFAGSDFSQMLATLGAGSTFNFASALNAFRIRFAGGFTVDSEDPQALPIQLNFNQASGNSFTMTPLLAQQTGVVPEPMSMALLGTGLAGLAGVAMRRRRRQDGTDA